MSNWDIKAFVALFLSSVLAFTSCLEVIEDSPEAVGYLAPVSVSFDLTVEELAETKSLPLPVITAPSEDEILFVVKDRNGDIIYSECQLWTEPLVIPVGNYSIEASHGANTFGAPYFYASASGNVTPYEKEQIQKMVLKVNNSLVAVNVDTELASHFFPTEMRFVSAGVDYPADLGEYCFVPSGSKLSVRLDGTNSMGNSTSFTYDLSSPEPRSAYEVNCGKSSTNWPSIIFPADKVVSWATRIYITAPADFRGDISAENKSALLYEAIPSSSSDWSQAKVSVIDNDIHVIKGLSPGTEYKVRARAGVLVSSEIKLTPEFSGVAASAVHTSTSSVLDGTNVTIYFTHASSEVKASIKSWSFDLLDSNDNLRRAGLSLGTSEGRKITSSDGWPYLPLGTYKILATATMQDGEVVKSVVSDVFVTEKPTFTVTASAYTSYNKYLDRNLDFANNVANKHTVFERKANVAISDALLSNSNYSSIRSSSITFNSTTLGTFNTNSKDFGNDANCTAWQNYPFKASMTFDGVTKEASVDCHITGLPYITKSMVEADWSLDSWNCEYNNGIIQLGGVSGSGKASATSNMKFYIPSNVKIRINTNATVRAYRFVLWYNTDFSVSVNGTTIITQNSNNQDNDNTGKNYNLSGVSEFSSSAYSVILKSSYQSAGPWSKVHSIEILYE